MIIFVWPILGLYKVYKNIKDVYMYIYNPWKKSNGNFALTQANIDVENPPSVEDFHRVNHRASSGVHNVRIGYWANALEMVLGLQKWPVLGQWYSCGAADAINLPFGEFDRVDSNHLRSQGMDLNWGVPYRCTTVIYWNWGGEHIFVSSGRMDCHLNPAKLLHG